MKTETIAIKPEQNNSEKNNEEGKDNTIENNYNSSLTKKSKFTIIKNQSIKDNIIDP